MQTPDVSFSAITTLHTRFLYPFFYRRDGAHDAARSMQDVHLAERDGGHFPMWSCPGPHDLYSEEVLDHVVNYLFPDTESAGCRYLTLTGAAESRWFGHLVAQFPGSVTMPLRLVPAAGIELFLTNFGVALLSMAFATERETLTPLEAIECNYRLSQLHGNAGALHHRHAADEPQHWDSLPPAIRQRIPPIPGPQTAVAERLAQPGGTVRPNELVQMLLQPLTDFALRPVQERLSVYTVARFNAAVDFAQPAVRSTYAPLLAALAQVEEASHAGVPADSLGIAHAVLNRRHWAGVSLLGAAHLVADQTPPEHPFNTARVPRVFLRYFVPYLAALLQRHTLHRAVDDATTLVLAASPDLAAGLTALRKHLLTFAVSGHFTHVSTRETLHRYYRLCQDGLDVPQAMAAARQALRDLDAQHTSERQMQVAADTAQHVAATRQLHESMQRLQHDMTEHLGTVAHVQIMVEYIEILLVSVYAAHLWHMLEPHVHWTWLRQEWWIMPHGSWGVLLIAFVAGGMTAFCLKPWRLHKRHHGRGA